MVRGPAADWIATEVLVRVTLGLAGHKLRSSQAIGKHYSSKNRQSRVEEPDRLRHHAFVSRKLGCTMRVRADICPFPPDANRWGGPLSTPTAHKNNVLCSYSIITSFRYLSMVQPQAPQ